LGENKLKLPSNQVRSFAQVPVINAPRSSFDRSHGYKTTFDSGYLIPFYADEILPGDSQNLSATLFARLLTPIYPVMDNLYLDTFYFFVPLRLVWNNFQAFMGEQVDPDTDITTYVCPTVTGPSGAGITIGSLADYLGLPTGIASVEFNAFHTRAYNLIWNTWFRDQNLQDSLVVDKDDGPDTYTDYVLKKRGRRHDYFTSCLPFSQKGAAVSLPLGTEAPVIGNGSPFVFSDATTESGIQRSGTTLTGPALSGSVANLKFGYHNDPATGIGLKVDLSDATAATINSLRLAVQMQAFLEIDARGGTRYIEILKSHFGVTSPDARLQRPEYLGGNSVPINFNAVAQTSATGVTGTPQGNLAAFASGTSHGTGYVKSFVEHGVVLGLCMVRADQTYQQGRHRMWTRETRFDFAWPVFAHLGEQAVLNSEIYMQGTSADALTFGYQERYAEYRFKPSQVTGKFRSTASGTLDAWHLAIKYTSLPTLGDTFIQDSPPVSRIVAVTSQPEFQMDCFISLKHARCLPVYSVPSAMGRL